MRRSNRAPKPKRQRNQPNNANRRINAERKVAKVRGSSNLRDFGSQLSSVVKNGVGATLRAIPTTRDFARVYLDPFSRHGARIPDFPVMPSTLIRVEHEFTMTATINGYGWSLFQPINMIRGDVPYVWFTTGGTAPPSFATSGTNVSFTQAPSPYTTASFEDVSDGGGGLATRIVSFGIKVLNISALQNKGGKIYFAQEDARLNNTLIGGDQTTLVRYPGYKAYPIGNDKNHYYHRMITDRADLLYNIVFKEDGQWHYVDSVSISGNASAEDTPYMGAYFSGSATTQPETFNVQVCAHFEVIGQTINTPGLGVTKSDSKGLENIQSAASHTRLSSPDHKDHISDMPVARQESVISNIIHGANDLLSPVPGLTGKMIDMVESGLMGTRDGF